MSCHSDVCACCYCFQSAIVASDINCLLLCHNLAHDVSCKYVHEGQSRKMLLNCQLFGCDSLQGLHHESLLFNSKSCNQHNILLTFFNALSGRV